MQFIFKTIVTKSTASLLLIDDSLVSPKQPKTPITFYKGFWLWLLIPTSYWIKGNPIRSRPLIAGFQPVNLIPLKHTGAGAIRKNHFKLIGIIHGIGIRQS
jgi:hypothetical protein